MKPEKRIELLLLMYEISVLTVKLLRLLKYIILKEIMGKYLDSNQEPTMPQIVTPPIELHLP